MRSAGGETRAHALIAIEQGGPAAPTESQIDMMSAKVETGIANTNYGYGETARSHAEFAARCQPIAAARRSLQSLPRIRIAARPRPLRTQFVLPLISVVEFLKPPLHNAGPRIPAIAEIFRQEWIVGVAAVEHIGNGNLLGQNWHTDHMIDRAPNDAGSVLARSMKQH